MKILTYTAIPARIGGRLETGLSVITWQIAKGLNATELNCDILTQSTFKYKQQIESTNIYGFSILRLLVFFLKFKGKYKYIQKAHGLSKMFHKPLIKLYFELIFINYGIKICKPDIFHIHGIYVYLLVKTCSLPKDIKMLVTIHGITGWDKYINNYKTYRTIEEQITKDKNITVSFVSSLIREDWINYYGNLYNESYVIVNGIDSNIFKVTHFSPKRNNASIKLICIGTISERKGQKRIAEALSKYSDKIQFNITFVGSCNNVILTNEIMDILADSNVKFEFTDTVSPQKIADLLNKSDFMILPSSSEGFGLVYIESIMCGTPVILPKNLPIAKEKGILSNVNSILMDDSTSESILITLKEIEKHAYPREVVAKTCLHLTLEKMTEQYASIIKTIVK